MSRLKLTLLGVMAVMALSASVAASAQAHEFLIEGAAVTAETPVVGAGTTSQVLKGTLLGVPVTITCSTLAAKGNIDFELIKSHASSDLHYTSCTTTVTGCTVTEVLAKTALLLEGTTLVGVFRPLNGSNVFAEVHITGCALEGKYPVEGKQTCELPKASENIVEHEVVCKTTGSELTFGGSSATYEGNSKVKLESGKKWSAI
jgi:hypothetical protein